MNKCLVMLTVLLMLVSAPLAALAMDSDNSAEHKGMEHSMNGSMDHSMHQGMKMDHAMGDMKMIGECERDGVNAMAHIKVYGPDAVASMSKMGMNGTHHLMIYFQKSGDKEMMTDGMAAVKITGPDGKTSKPVKLMAMGQAFGSDVAMSEPGEYKIEVGTKLKDGKKRQFEFYYVVK